MSATPEPLPVLEAARTYTERGWRCVPIKDGEKRPSLSLKGWQKLRLEPGDLPRYFTNGEGVGLLLGDASAGLVDVDLDCPEAVRAASLLLPDTAMIHGRPGRRASHHWYRVATPVPKTLRLTDPEDGATLCELRGTGAQTVVPPSVHPSGEVLEWERQDEPAHARHTDLELSVHVVAAAAMLARAWPKQGGRHDGALALAGVLLCGGMAAAEAERFVTAVADAAQDEEREDRVRAVTTTAAALKRGARVTGWTTALKVFGKKRLRRAAEWLELRTGLTLDGGAHSSEHTTLQTDEAPDEGGEARERAALAAAGLTEDALALEFTRRHGNDLRHVAEWGKWLSWDGTRWRFDRTHRVFDLARGVCREAARMLDNRKLRARIASAQTVANVVRLAMADRAHARASDEWDADLWLLNTPRGTVELKTGELRPHRRSDGITKATTVAPGGSCPTWEAGLRRWAGDDSELVAFLQRLVGYALTGSTREQVFAFLYGTGANGKGCFLNTLTAILGDYATTAPMDTFTVATGERHPTDLAMLRGARFVAAQETADGRRWDEARVKALTGGDPISARFMRQDYFTFVPQFTLIVAGNHKPGVRSVDEAMKRRLLLVPFNVYIPPEERDKGLAEKLRVEASGVLAWAIRGCLEWQQDGLRPPEDVLAATNDYFQSEDSVGRWLAECCVLAPNVSATKAELYVRWKTWAEAAGEYVQSQRWLLEELQGRRLNLVEARVGKDRDRTLVGIGLQGTP